MRPIDKARSMRLGMAGCVPVLAALPASIPAITKALDRHPSGVARMVREFRQLGLASMVGEERTGLRSKAPVWGFGAWPRERLGGRPRAQTIAFASLVATIRARPSSVSDIVRATGIYEGVARKVIAALRDAGMARVVAWRVHHGSPIQLHGLGAGPDAERPRALTKSEVNARYNARLRVQRNRRARIAAIPRSVFDLAAVAS